MSIYDSYQVSSGLRSVGDFSRSHKRFIRSFTLIFGGSWEHVPIGSHRLLEENWIRFRPWAPPWTSRYSLSVFTRVYRSNAGLLSCRAVPAELLQWKARKARDIVFKSRPHNFHENSFAFMCNSLPQRFITTHVLNFYVVLIVLYIRSVHKTKSSRIFRTFILL